MTFAPSAKAKADLEELAQIVAALAPLLPQFAVYALALDVALEALALAVGTIRPSTAAEDVEAAKTDPLGMG